MSFHCAYVINIENDVSGKHVTQLSDEEDDSVDEYARIWKNLVLPGVIFLGGGARFQTERMGSSSRQIGFRTCL
jgi:hypothetical protein